jgi:hypothetical protein
MESSTRNPTAIPTSTAANSISSVPNRDTIDHDRNSFATQMKRMAALRVIESIDEQRLIALAGLGPCPPPGCTPNSRNGEEIKVNFSMLIVVFLLIF